ncbi:unnamed protein product [Rotaria magnacalcarata]
MDFCGCSVVVVVVVCGCVNGGITRFWDAPIPIPSQELELGGIGWNWNWSGIDWNWNWNWSGIDWNWNWNWSGIDWNWNWNYSGIGLELLLNLKKKAQKVFSDTNAFIELSYNPFNEILDKVIQLLNTLRGKGFIRKWQYEQMMPDRTNCELAHLYFNPKTHKNGIPVRSIESTIHASTTKISKFLDKILRPIFDDKCKDTTIIDGASLITELSKYNKKGLLKPTILFCTFDIRNLYTMLPQEESLDILMAFLHAHGYRKVKGISIDTIKKLASIILKDNVFAYGKKIYKQTTGGAMGSSLTFTLANIFMSNWQKNIVEEQTNTGEFYGRY